MPTETSLIVCTHCGAVNRFPESRALSTGKCGKCKTRLGASIPVEVTETVFAKIQSRDQGPYVLDVWAPWCGPCNLMAPAYAAAAARFSGDIRFLKLNSEQFPKAAAHLNIRGIPALFFFEGGKLISQKSGALPESAILQWVNDVRK